MHHDHTSVQVCPTFASVTVGPGELRIRRIRIRITSWGIMGSWPRQPSPKGSVGCGDFVCHVECLRKLLEVLDWLNEDD